MRVALLEDEPALAAAMQTVVQAAGHATHVFTNGLALTTGLRQESFDLLLLDWNVPGLSGFEILAWAHAQLSPCPPIIMITSHADEADIVRALDAGADDYIIKPAAPGVLSARIAAMLRRAYPTMANTASVEVLHGASFDHGHDSVRIGSTETSLTAREFALALALFRNLDRPLSRNHLLETVWGRNPDLETRTLETHISRLRVKLGLRPENGYRLLPVYSFGYRLERIEPRGETIS